MSFSAHVLTGSGIDMLVAFPHLDENLLSGRRRTLPRGHAPSSQSEPATGQGDPVGARVGAIPRRGIAHDGAPRRKPRRPGPFTCQRARAPERPMARPAAGAGDRRPSRIEQRRNSI